MMKQNQKKRIDTLLVEKQITDSRECAKKMIAAGEVIVGEHRVLKASEKYNQNVEINVVERSGKYVSRGGEKLEGALQYFDFSVQGLVCIDVGISTGGFTDCLLRHGASHVYGIDVGYGQVAWKLRNDPRITLLERTNIRYIDSNRIDPPVDLAVIDVSFISLTKIIERVIACLKPDGKVIALVKPQFEVGKGKVGKGGIVKNEKLHHEVLEQIRTFLSAMGISIENECKSPIQGAKGNIEYFIMFSKEQSCLKK